MRLFGFDFTAITTAIATLPATRPLPEIRPLLPLPAGMRELTPEEGKLVAVGTGQVGPALDPELEKYLYSEWRKDRLDGMIKGLTTLRQQLSGLNSNIAGADGVVTAAELVADAAGEVAKEGLKKVFKVWTAFEINASCDTATIVKDIDEQIDEMRKLLDGKDTSSKYDEMFTTMANKLGTTPNEIKNYTGRVMSKRPWMTQWEAMDEYYKEVTSRRISHNTPPTNIIVPGLFMGAPVQMTPHEILPPVHVPDWGGPGTTVLNPEGRETRILEDWTGVEHAVKCRLIKSFNAIQPIPFFDVVPDQYELDHLHPLKRLLDAAKDWYDDTVNTVLAQAIRAMVDNSKPPRRWYEYGIANLDTTAAADKYWDLMPELQNMASVDGRYRAMERITAMEMLQKGISADEALANITADAKAQEYANDYLRRRLAIELAKGATLASLDTTRGTVAEIDERMGPVEYGGITYRDMGRYLPHVPGISEHEIGVERLADALAHHGVERVLAEIGIHFDYGSGPYTVLPNGFVNPFVDHLFDQIHNDDGTRMNLADIDFGQPRGANQTPGAVNNAAESFFGYQLAAGASTVLEGYGLASGALSFNPGLFAVATVLNLGLRFLNRSARKKAEARAREQMRGATQRWFEKVAATAPASQLNAFMDMVDSSLGAPPKPVGTVQPVPLPYSRAPFGIQSVIDRWTAWMDIPLGTPHASVPTTIPPFMLPPIPRVVPTTEQLQRSLEQTMQNMGFQLPDNFQMPAIPTTPPATVTPPPATPEPVTPPATVTPPPFTLPPPPPIVNPNPPVVVTPPPVLTPTPPPAPPPNRNPRRPQPLFPPYPFSHL